jgi:hypothetical protein
MEDSRNSQDKTFHLYLLIGQSNMAGRGEVEPQDKQVHPRVFALDKSCKWVPATDPIHFDKPSAGVGPGLTFGKTMAEFDPSVRIGLIPCAAGGSPITVWKPGGYWHGTNNMPYDNALHRTQLAMAQGALKGILWHQGEADSRRNEEELYENRLIALIGALRTHLGMPDIPFMVATLGDFFIESHPEGLIVNGALSRIPQRVRYTTCVESSGLDHKGDSLHFSAKAARELGRRYAKAIYHTKDAGHLCPHQ